MSETNDNPNAYRLRELSVGLDRLAELARDIHADEPSPARPIDAVWAAAPLVQRLKFVRDILPVESALQPALRQASALEELRLRGDELETWLTRYPTLFADAITLLTNIGAADNGTDSSEDRDPAVMLGTSTLAEAQETLERELAGFGIRWISSEAGDQICADHEVVGEEPSPYPKATIARCVRPGFRRRDKLELPAQVVRSMGTVVTPEGDVPTPNPLSPLPTSFAPPAASSYLGAEGTLLTGKGESNRCVSTPNAERLTPNTEYPSHSPTPPHLTSPTRPPPSLVPRAAREPWGEEPVSRTPNTDPEWLVILGQRAHGCKVDVVNELVRQLRELVALGQSGDIDSVGDRQAQLSSLLAPLAPLLSMRYADSIPGVNEEWGAALLEARDPILSWLRETFAVEPISPQRGDRFDEAVMDAVETRRTVHANEIETVARVERIGLKRAGAPILRAQVVRYIAGSE